LLQCEFRKAVDEWQREFRKVLREHNVAVKYDAYKDTYFDLITGQKLEKDELIARLKLFLTEEFIEKISFDL
jgi:hypothetical protein